MIDPVEIRAALRALVGPTILDRAEEQWQDREADWELLRARLQRAFPNTELRVEDVRDNLAVLDEVSDRRLHCSQCDPGMWKWKPNRVRGDLDGVSCRSPLRAGVIRDPKGQLKIEWTQCGVYGDWAQRNAESRAARVVRVG